MSYPTSRPVRCVGGRKYHRWVVSTFAIPRGEGHYDVGVDHSRRVCRHCGAQGSVNKMGIVEMKEAE